MASGADSLTERAYSYTKARIIDLSFDSGTMISEGEIASQLGISRTPVREAFLRLEAEGLLQLFPKRGALVVPPTPQEVDDLIEARQIIEGWAVVRATERPMLATTLVARLSIWLDTRERALGEGDDVAFQEADRQFHEEMVGAGGNGLLLRFYRSLRDRQLRVGTVALRVDPARARRILDEHRQLMEAIGAGAATIALEHTAAHLEATRAALGRTPRNA